MKRDAVKANHWFVSVDGAARMADRWVERSNFDVCKPSDSRHWQRNDLPAKDLPDRERH